MDCEGLETKQVFSITNPLVSGWGRLNSASWLVTRPESGCESAHCENRASLVVGRFFIDMPLGVALP